VPLSGIERQESKVFLQQMLWLKTEMVSPEMISILLMIHLWGNEFLG